PAPDAPDTRGPVRLAEVLSDRELNRLNVGIFVLHAVLMSLFVTVPFDLVEVGLESGDHWLVYAAVMLGSLLYLLPALRWSDRGRSKAVFVVSIAIVAASQVLLLRHAESLIGIG